MGARPRPGRRGVESAPAGENLQRLFTSVQIYRKCLASTYQGWGLQSLVSEKKERGEINKSREGEEHVAVWMVSARERRGARLSLCCQRRVGRLGLDST